MDCAIDQYFLSVPVKHPVVITWIILNMSLLLIVFEHQVSDQYGNSVDVDGCLGNWSEFVFEGGFSLFGKLIERSALLGQIFTI